MPIPEIIDQLPPLPNRPDDGHKGTFGKVLIFAGNPGMTGAAVLSGLGALRSGAGLVYVASSEKIIPVIAAAEPSYLTVPLPVDQDAVDQNGNFTTEAEKILTKKLEETTAAIIGPGLGRSMQLDQMIKKIYTNAPCPVVVDADALNALASQKIDWKERTQNHPRILTPHLGEFSRMTGIAIEQIQKNGEQIAAKFAQENDVVLLLKGADTIITDGGQLARNKTGNSGMATGGSGDVLSGIIVALLAQKMKPFQATQLAAHVHGLAGDLAIQNISSRSLIASDLPNFLGKAFKSLE